MARWPLFFGAAFLWLAVGPVVLLTLASLGSSVLADPPPVLRLKPPPYPADDAVALFRAVQRHRNGGVEGLDELRAAARAALEARFPPGSDADALVAFLTAEGPDRSAHCQRDASEGKRRYYCRISYGSLAATTLGLERWHMGNGWSG